MRTGKLTAKKVDSILAGRVAGRYHGDGGGLWLVVSKRDESGRALAASWVYRYMLHGKSAEMGFGSAWDISLADAREGARVARQRVKKDKVDVLAERREQERVQRDARKIELARRMTFRDVAESLMAAKDPGWRNGKHRNQWRSTLQTYAYPIIGDTEVSAIDTPMVVRVVEPLWLTKTETASRLRGRLEAVLDRARALGLRNGENPARWKGHLEHLLPQKTKVAPVQHHEALAYPDIGTFMAELREQKGVAARGLEFLILTCARTGEVIGCRWNELDLDARVWAVPAERMKANKEHRVPLADRAIAILAEMREIRTRRQSEYVFQGAKEGSPLSNMSMLMLLRRMGHSELTVHGFRATARSWMAAQTNFPREVAEMALAHDVGEKVERAYQRTDMFAKRRQLSDAWARYCDKPAQGGNGKVVLMGAV